MHRHVCSVLAITFLLANATAQKPPTPCDAECAALKQYVAAQFGESFTVVRTYAALKGDLDGDGAEDTVVVAQSKTPLADQAEFHFKAIDPYDGYFGWGNPNITAQFAAQDGERAVLLLIVHGWREPTPKAKFVVLNTPFDKLSIARMSLKKKAIWAIHAEEITGIVSSLYWDGKKYKWSPTAAQ
jgi:hypothetical protein